MQALNSRMARCYKSLRGSDFNDRNYADTFCEAVFVR